MRRRLNAVLLLLAGATAALVLMFLPDKVFEIRDELAWRNRVDAYDYMRRQPRGRYELLALAELDRAQQSYGLVSRLVSSRYGPGYEVGGEVLSPVFSPDGAQVITAGTTTAKRWDVASGALSEIHGDRSRAAAQDPRKWGFGFSQAAWYEGGAGAVFMTAGPHSLWFFASPPRGPVLLDGERLTGLVGQGGRLAYLSRSEFANVFEIASGRVARLAHPDVNLVAIAPDGRAVTASRDRIKWWREGVLEREVPVDAAYNPTAISDNARWMLVPDQIRLEMWATGTGARRVVQHDAEVTAACAAGTYVATGTADGQVFLWADEGDALVRHFRASAGRIDQLACHPARLLSVAHGDDTRIWDVAGRPQPALTIRPLEPEPGWITRLGADHDLPGRWPRLTALLEDLADVQVKAWALGILATMLFALHWLADARHRPRRARHEQAGKR